MVSPVPEFINVLAKKEGAGDPEPIRDEESAYLFMTSYLDLGLHRPVGGWGQGRTSLFGSNGGWGAGPWEPLLPPAATLRGCSTAASRAGAADEASGQKGAGRYRAAETAAA